MQFCMVSVGFVCLFFLCTISSPIWLHVIASHLCLFFFFALPAKASEFVEFVASGSFASWITLSFVIADVCASVIYSSLNVLIVSGIIWGIVALVGGLFI
jgi:hypothetical protein